MRFADWLAENTSRRKLPKWVSPLHRAWLSLRTREVLYTDLAKAMGVSVVDLEKLNGELHGGHDNGWFTSSVTTTRALAGDKLWAYLETLRRELGVG